MTEFLAGLLGAVIGGSFAFCLFGVTRALSIESRAEEEAGAPEGAFQFPHIHCPDASGLKLSVRAHYQSVPSIRPVQSSGGG